LERTTDGNMAARRAAVRVDPPRGLAYVVECQTEAFELASVEVLPGDGSRPMPVGDDPARAGATERTVSVVDEQRRFFSFHRFTVTFRLWIAARCYNRVMLRLRRPAAEELARFLANANDADLSYAEVGATMGSSQPVGYRIARYEHRLSPDASVFARAVNALRAWKAHVGAGVEIIPKDARVTVGASVLFGIRTASLWAAAPCRVVYVVDQQDRFSFAYGTLPGHPEQGEVAMTDKRGEVGGVAFRIVSFSRTVDPLARIGSPVTQLIQRRLTNQYVEALASASEPVP
jgi:uncharacterized protein (UPF0548 family)